MVPEDDSTFARGRRVDRYEIRAPIGAGGMGAVYRAFDTKLGRTVALKTVVAGRRTSLSEEMRGRFTREALAASKVSHRNVVQVLDYGFAEDGSPFIVMEYLRGRDLGACLRDSAAPLAVDYVADVMLGVCAALHACHEAGIVHRDLKPANIFLADTDMGAEVKVLDFGVSKAPLAGDLTEEGQIIGTPQYLSPEQVEGRAVPESDQYALGMVLYVCLTKHMPYEEHHSLSLLRAIELGRFRPPRDHRPDLPVALEEIILRTLRLSPAERFESVHALGRALLPFASPRGRVQWRDYYLQAPVARPEESTFGIVVGEEEARATPKEARATPKVALPPGAVLLPSTDSVSGDRPPQAADAGSPQAGGPGPQALLSTKLDQPPSAAPAAPNEGSLLDVAGESTAGEQNVARAPRVAPRRLAAGVLAVCGRLAGAVFLYARTRSDRAPLLPATSAAAPGVAASPVPPPAAVAGPGPAAPPVPPPAAVAAPGAADREAPLEPAARPPVAKPAMARAHKRVRHEKPKPSVEAAPDGVPIMP